MVVVGCLWIESYFVLCGFMIVYVDLFGIVGLDGCLMILMCDELVVMVLVICWFGCDVIVKDVNGKMVVVNWLIGYVGMYGVLYDGMLLKMVVSLCMCGFDVIVLIVGLLNMYGYYCLGGFVCVLEGY